MSTINGDGGRTTPLPKTNGEKFNGTSGEATDDVKATQQHIKNLETELKHAREALSGLLNHFFCGEIREFFFFFFLNLFFPLDKSHDDR
jgi:hypothetical protein